MRCCEMKKNADATQMTKVTDTLDIKLFSFNRTRLVGMTKLETGSRKKKEKQQNIK